VRFYLFVLVGGTGSGKTELSKALKERLKLRRVISCTTRPPRDDEVDGVHYRFLSEEAFKKGLSDGHFVEYDQPYGKHYYGRQHRDLAEVGQYHCICDMTEVGVAALQEQPQRYDKVIVIRLEPRNMPNIEREGDRSNGDEARKHIPIRVDEVVVNDHGDPQGLTKATDRLVTICQQFMHPEG